LASEVASTKALVEETSKTEKGRDLAADRKELLEHIRETTRSGDLAKIIANERAIVESDLNHYSNSKAMDKSLKMALIEINLIEKNLAIVDDKTKYQPVDDAHSNPKNRKAGLPKDEARQGFSSHYARLLNMDKSRLADDEKAIIDARKSAMYTGEKLYAERQAKTLGVQLSQGKKRGQSM